MKPAEIARLTKLLDILQDVPGQVNFAMGFIPATESSDEMMTILIRIWSSYCEGHGILKEIQQIRKELDI